MGVLEAMYECPYCGEDEYTEQIDVMHSCKHIKVLLIHCNNCGVEFLALRTPDVIIEDDEL